MRKKLNVHYHRSTGQVVGRRLVGQSVGLSIVLFVRQWVGESVGG